MTSRRPCPRARLKAEDKYLALDAYGVAEYTMAAKVRFADIQYGYAQKIANAPIPTPIQKAGETNPDLIARFETTRDQNLKKYLDEARSQWVEVVDLAKQGGLSNRWSRLAQENLGREFLRRIHRRCARSWCRGRTHHERTIERLAR